MPKTEDAGLLPVAAVRKVKYENSSTALQCCESYDEFPLRNVELTRAHRPTARGKAVGTSHAGQLGLQC